MMRSTSARRLSALLAAAFLACAAVSLNCGGTDDLSPRPEPRPYVVNGVEDCAVLANLFLKFRQIDVAAGAHTLRLEASTYGDQLDSTYQTHFVCVLLGAGLDSTSRQDWLFTLNGVGDERVVHFASASSIYVGYLGTVPLAAHGSSVISIDAVGQYEIQAAANGVVIPNLSEQFIDVEYDSMGAGNYEFTLARSSFSPRPGLVTPLVLLYLVEPEEGMRHHLFSSLNGAGDAVTLHLEPNARVMGGFVDDLAIDNAGGADVEVSFQGAR